MVVMLSRVELRNKYDFQSPLPSRRYFVLTYHFYGTNSYSTNVLHKYGNLVMPNLEGFKIRKTFSLFAFMAFLTCSFIISLILLPLQANVQEHPNDGPRIFGNKITTARLI